MITDYIVLLGRRGGVHRGIVEEPGALDRLLSLPLLQTPGPLLLPQLQGEGGGVVAPAVVLRGVVGEYRGVHTLIVQL